MSSDGSSNDSLFMYVLNLTVSVPSLIGTVFMIYFCGRNFSINTSNKLLLFLAISDFLFLLTNVFLFIDWPGESTICQVDGMLRRFSGAMTLYIVSLIAILHYYSIKQDETFSKIGGTRFVVLSITIGTVISLAIATRYL